PAARIRARGDWNAFSGASAGRRDVGRRSSREKRGRSPKVEPRLPESANEKNVSGRRVGPSQAGSGNLDGCSRKRPEGRPKNESTARRKKGGDPVSHSHAPALRGGPGASPGDGTNAPDPSPSCGTRPPDCGRRPLWRRHALARRANAGAPANTGRSRKTPFAC